MIYLLLDTFEDHARARVPLIALSSKPWCSKRKPRKSELKPRISELKPGISELTEPIEFL